MKMDKKNIILMTIAMIVIAGCRGGGGFRKDDPGDSDYNYRTGSIGLEIELPSGNPRRLYENENDIRYLVEVRNHGAYPQMDETNEFYSRLWIGGFDESIIRASPAPGTGIDLESQELEGRSPYNRDGGYTIEDFSLDILDLPSGTTFYNPTLILTVTYFYKTIASPVVCIDPEPRSTNVRQKVCTTSDVSPGTQGAPVAVTKVTQDVTSQSILFKIQVENVGSGTIIPEGFVDNDPNRGYDWKELNQVKIENIAVGDTRMSSCRPDNYVELFDEKATIFCRLDKSVIGGRVYTSPLNIELSYGYSFSVQDSIGVFEEVQY